jgi:hypothetical protein
VADYFEEQVSQVLKVVEPGPRRHVPNRLSCRRVDGVAHVWREPSFPELEEEFSEADREFLRQCHVSTDRKSSERSYKAPLNLFSACPSIGLHSMCQSPARPQNS